jgi:PhnB protein
MTPAARGPVISLMLAVPDASAAAQWYAQALGATELWDLGGVVGLAVGGAPFFLGEPANNGWDTPTALTANPPRLASRVSSGSTCG